jgi:hypothetical protein
MSTPLNDSNKPPVNPGAHVQQSPAQGGISSPFAPSNLPFSQHPALRNGVAGNTPISNPTPPKPSLKPAGY